MGNRELLLVFRGSQEPPMHSPLFPRLVSLPILLIWMSVSVYTYAQDPTSGGGKEKGAPSKRATMKDSIVVGAHLTPDEIEDGKINDVYQPIYHWTREHDCLQIIKLCETKVIPMAESSKFQETRNKFLFLANRDMASCQMKLGKYSDAASRYQKLFEYVQVWPGKVDSAYPQVYESLGAALIMQGKWKEAEVALESALQIFDEQIKIALSSDSKFKKDEMSKHLQSSQAQTRNLLGNAYFQDGRREAAMDMIEAAYTEMAENDANPAVIQQVIDNGRAVSLALGDPILLVKWETRALKAK
jgi:tetratricopeptide (TPR) repeat protein